MKQFSRGFVILKFVLSYGKVSYIDLLNYQRLHKRLRNKVSETLLKKTKRGRRLSPVKIWIDYPSRSLHLRVFQIFFFRLSIFCSSWRRSFDVVISIVAVWVVVFALIKDFFRLRSVVSVVLSPCSCSRIPRMVRIPIRVNPVSLDPDAPVHPSFFDWKKAWNLIFE